ncbi:MAG TPA: acylneuraminate cytidylyltransferase family protein, partial [Spirochaetia bacterium]|nr:acylneuraminate cytidylyltransferase family protein [Spirochaetia bacterium]
MSGKQNILAVIPARGGSKRLPSKNILPLSGKPLVVWSIEAALQSQRVDHAVLSTDSPEIVAACRSTGIDTPFLRPAALATDQAASMDVVRHAIDFLKSERGEVYDYVVLLQPTSPLRTAEDIDAAVSLLTEKKAAAVVSVCEVDHPPEWTGTLPEDLSMANFLRPDAAARRSQELPRYYRLNGAIYICHIPTLLEEGSFFIKTNIYAYIM